MFFNDFEENMNETIMKVFIVDLHASSFNDLSKFRYYVNLDKLFTFRSGVEMKFKNKKWSALGSTMRLECGRK